MLKIGVFGVGHLGKFHLNNWKTIEGIELVGFYDPNDLTANAVTEQYGLTRYEDPLELMKQVDAVDIVAPTNYHYELCRQALRLQKHVFVEKPLAATIEEARELVKLVKEARVKLQVGHVERFNPAFQAALKYTTQPLFIEVHRLAQFNPRGTEVSVILDLMIHDLDIVLNLVKSPVKNISASGVAVMTDTPDITNVRLEFQNGCVANITSSRISMKKMRKIRLFQKDAYISIDFLERKTEVIKIKSDTDVGAFSFDVETPKGTRTIAIASPSIPENNPMKMELEAFRDAILKNQPVVVSELDGFLAMEVAQKILEKIDVSPLAKA